MTSGGLTFVISSLAIGGSETKIVRVANVLAKSGRSVRIAYLNGPTTLLDRLDSAIQVTNLNRKGKFSIASLHRLRGLLRATGGTVVAVNMYPLLYVVPAAMSLTIPTLNVIGMINTAKSVRDPVHVKYLYAPLLRRCNRVVFGCQSEMEAWSIGYGIESERCEYIYNGVDSDVFCPESFVRDGVRLRAHLGIPATSVVLGGIGRLAIEKNFDVLIKAAAALNSEGRAVYVILVGEGPERGRLAQLAREYRIEDKVRLLGQLHDVRPALAAMSVFVLPSSAVETFSNAALEAMSMARPVVLSEIAGALEMLGPEGADRIFPIGDVDSLIRVLTKLVDCADLRTEIGERARGRVMDKFSLSAMVERYAQLDR